MHHSSGRSSAACRRRSVRRCRSRLWPTRGANATAAAAAWVQQHDKEEEKLEEKVEAVLEKPLLKPWEQQWEKEKEKEKERQDKQEKEHPERRTQFL